MNESDGGPAFPAMQKWVTDHGNAEVRDYSGATVFNHGMSLRDWFAGMALQGLLSGPNNSGGDVSIGGEKVPYDRAAYMFADALLKVRKM